MNDLARVFRFGWPYFRKYWTRLAAGILLGVLFGLSNFKPMEFEAIAHALRWYEAGLDFGDALHLALSAKADGFATFDQELRNQAGKLGAFPLVSIAA